MSSSAAESLRDWLRRAFSSMWLTPVADRKESYYEPRMAPNLLEGHRIDGETVLQESEREAVAELLGWSPEPKLLLKLTESRLPRECNRLLLDPFLVADPLSERKQTSSAALR